MNNEQQQATTDSDIKSLCHNCGETLTEFLRQMEEHNAQVVEQSATSDEPNNVAADARPAADDNICPHCGKAHGLATSRPRIAVTPARGPSGNNGQHN